MKADEASTRQLEIRAIRPGDKQALSSGFQRLSEQSRYRRFLTPQLRLSATELRYLTEVDHHDHEAIVAVDPQTGEGIGVARYVRSPADATTAELAVAVIDDWQHLGVGSVLTEALADRARAEGVKLFTALVLADNQAMLNLLGSIGRAQIIHQELGTVELTVELPPRGLGRVRTLLRAVARREVQALSRGEQSQDAGATVGNAPYSATLGGVEGPDALQSSTVLTSPISLSPQLPIQIQER